MIGWLISVTRPVLGPLVFSTLMRIVNLSADIVLFGMTGCIVAAHATGEPAPSLWLLVVIAIVKAVARYLEQFSGHYVAFKALELLRAHAFSRLWPQAPGLTARSGDLLASLTRDVDRIEVVYAHTIAPVLAALVVPTAAVIAAGVSVGWSVAAIPLVAVLVSLTVVPALGTRSSLASGREVLAARGALTAHLTDSLFGRDEVLTYTRSAQRLAEMDGISERVASASRPGTTARAARRSLTTVLTLATATSIMTTGTGLDPVVLAALVAGSLRLFIGPASVEEALGHLGQALAAASRLHALATAEPAVRGGAAELPDVAGGSSARLDAVTYTYPGAAAPALDGVSLEIPAGTWTLFAGPSGSGKSTVAQLLVRYADPAGRVLVDGTDVREVTLESLRGRVVLVPQRAQVLDRTIGENVRLGKPGASDDEVWRALEIAHLADEVRGMPEGLATRVGTEGSELSGGQLARLCLARALILTPTLLILDEYAAHLGEDLEDRIRLAVREAHPDMTVVEVSHRAGARGDLVYRFDAGRVTLGAPGGAT